MGISTVTAGRILDGQLKGQTGKLSLPRFSNRTYSQRRGRCFLIELTIIFMISCYEKIVLVSKLYLLETLLIEECIITDIIAWLRTNQIRLISVGLTHRKNI